MTLLTAAQVALQLGLRPRSVYDLADSGRLACYRIGAGAGAVRFAQADVDLYLAACRCPARHERLSPAPTSLPLVSLLVRPQAGRCTPQHRGRKARPHPGALTA